MIRQQNGNTREGYRKARNEYGRIRKEKSLKAIYVVKKCKEAPKLFYRYVNGKLKHRDGIDKLKKDGKTYKTPAEMSELMNESFQSVFTGEIDFAAPRMAKRNVGIKEIQAERQEIKEMLGKLDTRKAMGPDGVNDWILKEC